MKKLIMNKEIFERQYNSMTISEMARLYNITPQTIHYHIRKMGMTKKGRSKKIQFSE